MENENNETSVERGEQRWAATRLAAWHQHKIIYNCSLTCIKHISDLSNLLIVLIKWFAVFPVEEGRNAHDLLLLVDNRQRQHVFDDEARLVHSLFLKEMKIRGSSRAHVNSCEIDAIHAYGVCVLGLASGAGAW